MPSYIPPQHLPVIRDIFMPWGGGLKWDTKSDSVQGRQLRLGHNGGDNMAIGFSIQRSMAG